MKYFFGLKVGLSVFEPTFDAGVHVISLQTVCRAAVISNLVTRADRDDNDVI